MKKRTRAISIIITAVLTLAILLTFPLSAFCAEGGENGATASTANEEISSETVENISSGETDNKGSTEDSTEGSTEDNAEDNADADGETAASPDGVSSSDTADKNIFSVIFSEISKHSAQLLSALAFIGSVIIMVCYKMGFVPMVKEGVHALAQGVSRLGEHTGDITDATERFCQDIANKLTETESVLNKMADTLSLLEKKLEKEGATRGELSALKTVMAGEVDMLYEIFMAAALPQYLKDSVGERIAAMRASLKDEEK